MNTDQGMVKGILPYAHPRYKWVECKYLGKSKALSKIRNRKTWFPNIMYGALGHIFLFFKSEKLRDFNLFYFNWESLDFNSFLS